MAKIIAEVIDFKGKIIFDSEKPDGTSRKFLSNRILTKLGWKPQINLHEGLKKTYKDYLNNYAK